MALAATPIRAVVPNDVPWCAGLFVGEGNVGRTISRNKSGRYEYLQIGMYDKRAISRFARCFGVKAHRVFLKNRQRDFYRVCVRGRRAEQVLAILWPFICGTDKADQARFYAARLHLTAWVTGRRTGQRPQLQLQQRGRKAA